MAPSPEDDFHDVTDEATRYARSRSRNLRRRQVPPGTRGIGRFLLLAGLGAAVLVIVLFLVLRNGGQEDGELRAVFDSRMGQLERKLSRLEGLEKKAGDLETRLTKYERAATKTSGSWESLEQRLNKLSQKVDTLEKAVVSAPRTSGGSGAEVAAPASGGRTAQHEVQRGDTLYGIAKQYGISVAELRRLNGLAPNPLIHPGQKLTVPSR